MLSNSKKSKFKDFVHAIANNKHKIQLHSFQQDAGCFEFVCLSINDIVRTTADCIYSFIKCLPCMYRSSKRILAMFIGFDQ